MSRSPQVRHSSAAAHVGWTMNLLFDQKVAIFSPGIWDLTLIWWPAHFLSLSSKKFTQSANIRRFWSLWCQWFFNIWPANVLSGFSNFHTDFCGIPNRFLKAFQFVNECPLQWLVSHGCATYRLQWGSSSPSCSTSWALVMLLRLQKKSCEWTEKVWTNGLWLTLAACFWGFLHSDQKIGPCGPQMFCTPSIHCNAMHDNQGKIQDLPHQLVPLAPQYQRIWFQCWPTDVCR